MAPSQECPICATKTFSHEAPRNRTFLLAAQVPSMSKEEQWRLVKDCPTYATKTFSHEAPLQLHLPLAAQVPSMSKQEQWRLVKDCPYLWSDNRTLKMNGTRPPRFPDFKLHDRALDVPLWLDSKETPDWAKQEFM